jgi:glycyl-tRNA synthetase beta chain
VYAISLRLVAGAGLKLKVIYPMAEFLVEILSQEIPARMQDRAAADLKRLVVDGLKKIGIEFAEANAYATPRRLTLVIDGLPDKQPDLREERRGPRADAPEKAISGFLGSVGLSSIDDCEQRETDKGTFLFVITEKKGVATSDVLPRVLLEAIENVPWSKSMRWGDTGFRWVRPIHSILAIFDGSVLDGALDIQGGSISFGDETCGHRFLSPGHFKVRDFSEYREKLLKAFVMLDSAEREAVIARELNALAKGAKLHVKDDPGLRAEVKGLVEWPVVLMGQIDEAFMDVPPEVLITSIRTHLKYFVLEKADGTLAPRFAVVSNMVTEDSGKAIVAGNERVLRARLADAKFFWDQDRKKSLASRTPALGDITFHAKLGTLDAKIDRVQALAVDLCTYVEGAERDRVRSAARLCKADLVSDMVGEFPELQGLMGRYYALHDGEHTEVAEAIADHYSPQGPGDQCPSAPVSIAVALADKIDTLAGFWVIDEKPTGSKDPYALRRAALGVIRLVVENGLRLPLRAVFLQAISAQPVQSEQAIVADDLLDFFADRLKVHLREKGVRHDLVSAVFALGGEDDLVRLLVRVDALSSFVESDDGANLLTAYSRAANILRIEEKKDSTRYDSQPDPAIFSLMEENTLAEALEEVMNGAQSALEKEDFVGAMQAMAELRGPVDAFFDKVTVNAEDSALRINRLKLLSGIRASMGTVADFDAIEG